MIFRIRTTKDFEKSYKRIKRSGKWNNHLQKELEFIIDELSLEKNLPSKYKDHSLTGELKNYKECHIKYDLLLIYKIEQNDLILILSDIGSHSYLFN
jgi:mRNA interferase YafQ